VVDIVRWITVGSAGGGLAYQALLIGAGSDGLDQGYAAAALTHALGGPEVQLLVRMAHGGPEPLAVRLSGKCNPS
jgi:hypothetical protein